MLVGLSLAQELGQHEAFSALAFCFTPHFEELHVTTRRDLQPPRDYHSTSGHGAILSWLRNPLPFSCPLSRTLDVSLL